MGLYSIGNIQEAEQRAYQRGLAEGEAKKFTNLVKLFELSLQDSVQLGRMEQFVQMVRLLDNGDMWECSEFIPGRYFDNWRHRRAAKSIDILIYDEECPRCWLLSVATAIAIERGI